MRRAQIAYFIILVFVIVAAVFLVISLRKETAQEETLPIKEEVSIYIKDCLIGVAKEGAYQNALSGGYYLYGGKGISGIPYYEAGPEMENISGELSEYIDYYLLACIDDFRPFEEKGISIEFENPSTEAQFSESGILIESTMKVRFGKNEILKHNAYLNGDYYGPYEFAGRIIEEEKQGSVCMTCREEGAEEKYELGIIWINETVTIFQIEDTSMHDHYNYTLRFAVESR